MNRISNAHALKQVIGRTVATVAQLAAVALLATPLVVTPQLALAAEPPAKAADDGSTEMQATIKRLIGAVRYKRDSTALSTFAGREQAEFLAGAQWAKATDAQKAEFVTLFHQMFASIAFPRIRQNFEKLETILYDKPTVRGDKATLGSTIVILHPVKKQEIVATYDLIKKDGKWLVVDVTVKGDKSMLTNIRDEQVQKLLAKGGWDHLLELMRKRVAKASK